MDNYSFIASKDRQTTNQLLAKMNKGTVSKVIFKLIADYYSVDPMNATFQGTVLAVLNNECNYDLTIQNKDNAAFGMFQMIGTTAFGLRHEIWANLQEYKGFYNSTPFKKQCWTQLMQAFGGSMNLETFRKNWRATGNALKLLNTTAQWKVLWVPYFTDPYIHKKLNSTTIKAYPWLFYSGIFVPKTLNVEKYIPTAKEKKQNGQLFHYGYMTTGLMSTFLHVKYGINF